MSWDSSPVVITVAPTGAEVTPEDKRATEKGIGREVEAFDVGHVVQAVRPSPVAAFEDNVYRGRGVLAASNAELVSDVADLVRTLGRQVATIDEARSALGLG